LRRFAGSASLRLAGQPKAAVSTSFLVAHGVQAPPIYSPPMRKRNPAAEVDGERGIADDLVVAAVESVLDIGIGGDAGVDGVPSAEIGANVAGGVVDVEAVEIIVGAAADEASTEVRSPTAAEIRQQRGGGVFGTAQQRLAGVVLRVDGSGIAENLSGCVSVCGIEQHPAAELGLQFDLGALGEA